MNLYCLPQVLFDDPHCKSKSFDCINAYASYLSLYKYSIYKNHLSDKNDNIYCVLTDKELASCLSCERKK